MVHHICIMVCFQVVCDSELMIINCIARWPGSVHDARILRESALFADVECYPKPLFRLCTGRQWLHAAWVAVDSSHQSTVTAYNAARCTVERCIGVMKRRWHCLHTELCLTPANACKVTCACFVLHNRATHCTVQYPMKKTRVQMTVIKTHRLLKMPVDTVIPLSMLVWPQQKWPETL